MKTTLKSETGKELSITFDQAPFSVAMAEVSALTGVPIVWGAEADGKYISGCYVGVDAYSLLLAIAKRYGLAMSELDGIVYLGSPSQSDTLSVVVRIPFVMEEGFKSLEACLSESGRIGVCGSCYIVSDYLDNLKKILAVVENLRNNLCRSYIAELYFIRMKNSDLVDLQAKLEAEAVDLFSCSWNLDTLFRATLDVSANSARTKITNTPRLYLSEGRKAMLSVGSEIVLSRNSVSAEGYSTVSGYDTFTDGVEVTLLPSRVDAALIALDVTLSVSKFDDGTMGVVPVSSKSRIETPGVLVTEGSIFFLGSLQMTEQSDAKGILGVMSNKNDEIVTVWGKIREVSLQN